MPTPVALGDSDVRRATGARGSQRPTRLVAHASFGDTLLDDETQSAAGTLAAGQCTCVRPV